MKKQRLLTGILALILLFGCAAPAAKAPEAESTSAPAEQVTAVQNTPAPAEPTPAAESTPAPAAPEQEEEAGLTPGTYEVSATGHNDVIVLDVEINETGIVGITVKQEAESAGICEAVYEQMIPAIVEGQTLNVDAVAGATVTRAAVIAAVTDAIKKAGGDTNDFMAQPEKAPAQTIEREVDVVVVGAGGAGIAAALEAKRAGASVLMLEKLSHIGGNTIISGGIVYGTGSDIQAANGLEGDSPEALAQYWYDRAEGNADMDMLQFVAERSGETIEWLVENGVEFNPAITAPGTAGVLRGIRCFTRGFGVVGALEEQMEQEGIEVLLNTAAYELISENGAVTGVKANSGSDTLTVKAKSVILTTGGFDANYEAVQKYSPDLGNAMSFSSPGNDGDAIAMAESVGAATVFKGGVIGYRTVPGMLYNDPSRSLSMSNGLGLTESGERYSSEVMDYPIFHKNMMATGSELFYIAFDSATPNEALESAAERGFAYKAESWDELAQAMGISADVLNATVTRYNELCAKGADDDFGKAAASMIALETAPFYALKVIPATIGSMGGLKIDLDTRVLDTNGDAIEGLYAAGAVANGDFFYQTYPASGSSLQMCFTFGRVAGQQAAAHAE